MEYKIPDNILIETELSDEQRKIFVEQINRFNELNKYYSVVSSPFFDLDNNIIFKEGTLIHGIKSYDEEKLESISKTGILTGQAVGISEDCETYYCADFHRVDKDMMVKDYCINFKHNDGRCPFGETRADNSIMIAFVVVPNESNGELLSYDCYRDNTKESDITKSFINMMPINDRNKGSSILYGVPFSCINGIVVGGKILDDKKKIDFLIEKFPHCYIITAFGELIYDPSKSDYLNYERINLRREKYCLARDKRKLEMQTNRLESENNVLKERYDKLMEAILLNCSSYDVANALIAIGWQGNIDEKYVDEMKSRKGR